MQSEETRPPVEPRGPDRRKRPTPMLSRFLFVGRRRGGRRGDEKDYVYVDKPGGWIVAAFVALLVLSLLDAPFLPRLKNLALSENQLSIKTVERIAAARDFRPAELDICHNRFSEPEAEAALRSASFYADLQRLCL